MWFLWKFASNAGTFIFEVAGNFWGDIDDVSDLKIAHYYKVIGIELVPKIQLSLQDFVWISLELSISLRRAKFTARDKVYYCKTRRGMDNDREGLWIHQRQYILLCAFLGWSIYTSSMRWPALSLSHIDWSGILRAMTKFFLPPLDYHKAIWPSRRLELERSWAFFSV